MVRGILEECSMMLNFAFLVKHQTWAFQDPQIAQMCWRAVHEKQHVI